MRGEDHGCGGDVHDHWSAIATGTCKNRSFLFSHLSREQRVKLTPSLAVTLETYLVLARSVVPFVRSCLG